MISTLSMGWDFASLLSEKWRNWFKVMFKGQDVFLENYDSSSITNCREKGQLRMIRE